MFFQIIATFFVLFTGMQAAIGHEAPSPVDSFALQAPQAILIDVATGTVLFEKNADQPMVPSSMTKILTVYAVFERLKAGTLKLTDLLPVSERAWRMQGSKMFVKIGDHVPVEDLLKGIIVQSGNDACIVIAEALAGSEESFAKMLTKISKALGAKNTYFLNSTGWPDSGHTSTARDLALFGMRTIQDFPVEYARYYSQKDFTYNGIKQGNRNPLLWEGKGDGLKTGHTTQGGYGLVGSALRQGRRLLFVINGLPSSKARTEEAHRLMEWGFREFDTYALFKKATIVEKAEIWGGQKGMVPLVLSEDVAITLRRRDYPQLKVTVHYDGPIAAPIAQGQILGKLIVTAPDISGKPFEKIFPLTAGHAVEKASFFQRFTRMIDHILWGKSE